MSSTLLWERTEAKQTSPLLVLKHGQKRVVVKRQRSYDLMLDSACKHFPSIPRDVVTLQTNQLDVCDGHFVDITAETWDEIIDLVTFVEVTRAEMALPVPLPLDTWAISLPDNRPAPSQVNNRNNSRNGGKITIKLVFPSGEIRSTKIPRSTRVDKLVADASRMLGYCPTDVEAIWGGTTMRQDWSIGSYNIKNGDFINLQALSIGSYDIEDGDSDSFNPQAMLELRGRKPVIYLYSPSDIDVSVKLSLTPEWSLSAIYPIVATKDHGQHIEWNVRTHQDGSLTEHNSGLDVAYLFWEAETNLQAFPRSPASKPQPSDTFSPTSSSLSDTDSVVIPVEKITVYLDKSLKALGLHTEARTSFITYWLPSILKHEYIALRFVPQAAYERAASLSISPQPDVVTRVFMLFRGISKEHLANWSYAQMQAERDVAWWVDVVGVDLARAGDTALFRVLEWGGMEVLI
ncbi:uncharacterized protein BJ212DRAFT_1483207 [Suillus subaureus]|uniref:Ubiquitin-like domain-containing protein n=1 Tax=Suillus subaureus TaxID=48587 RepID=A0A9P7E7F5_9AGAM|nr:uncharacterized protein BJ212DRAFT_1483207 [Suillus subaureus]KAG1812600.1 hypothetical protein BJ212DRAFT_1483207 [Suillus subaureus]